MMSKLFNELFSRCEDAQDPAAHHQMEKLAHAHDPHALNYIAVSAFLKKLTLDKKHWEMLHQAAEQGVPAARHNLLLLEILFHKKKFDVNAVKEFVHFADKNHLDDAWLTLGSLFYTRAYPDYPAAEACLAHLPGDPAALFQRGVINEKEGNLLGALAFYWQATLGDFGPAKARLSALAMAAQRNDRLEHELSKLIENNQSDPALKSSHQRWQEMLATAMSSEERQVITSYFLSHFASIAKASQQSDLVNQLNHFANTFYFEPAVLAVKQRSSPRMRRG